MRQRNLAAKSYREILHRDDDLADRFARPQKVKRRIGAGQLQGVAYVRMKLALAIPGQQGVQALSQQVGPKPQEPAPVMTDDGDVLDQQVVGGDLRYAPAGKADDDDPPAGSGGTKCGIELITADVEVGRIYEGRVARLMDFGAFVTILPGRDGLVHISQISNERVERVSDKLSEGDVVRVKVLEVDRQGRVRLSIKDV